MQLQQQQFMCGPAADGPTHTHSLVAYRVLLVRAVLTLAVKVWLCGMTRI